MDPRFLGWQGSALRDRALQPRVRSKRRLSAHCDECCVLHQVLDGAEAVSRRALPRGLHGAGLGGDSIDPMLPS